jgi:hypothetical protein
MSVTTVIQALDDLVDPVGLKAAQVKDTPYESKFPVWPL